MDENVNFAMFRPVSKQWFSTIEVTRYLLLHVTVCGGPSEVLEIFGFFFFGNVDNIEILENYELQFPK